MAIVMDEAASKLGSRALEDLPSRVKQVVERQAWVAASSVRLREHGHLIIGDVFVVPRTEHGLVARIDELITEVEEIDWRLHALTVTPVGSLDTPAAPVPPSVTAEL